MTFTLTPGNLQWLGLAKETTSGTPVAAPTVWIPVESPKWGANITALVDQALRGFMGTDFEQSQGARNDEVAYKTYLYPGSAFTHFRAILGGTDTVTGASDPYTHKVSVLNTVALTTYTLFLAMGDGKVMQVPGCVLGDLKMSVKANELPSLDVSWTGLSAAIITAPTNTPDTNPPMPPYTAAITIAGANLGKYTDMSLDLKRSVAPVMTLNGNANPSSIYCGVLTVTGSINGVFQGTTDTDLTNYLTNGQPALSFVINPQGDAVHTLTVQCSQIAYDKTDVQPSGNSYMTVANTFKALMNPTDATDGKQSPVQVQLKNTAATAL
jgi:hypothetical protein